MGSLIIPLRYLRGSKIEVIQTASVHRMEFHSTADLVGISGVLHVNTSQQDGLLILQAGMEKR